jgi:signal transduction histidine kinase
MTLRDWLKKYHTRPQMIVAMFMISVWIVFAVRSFYTLQAKNDTYVKQTSDLLSLAFGQNNRIFAESLLDMVLSQAGASSAEVCMGDRQIIGANQSLNSCTDKPKIFERIVEKNVTGSGTQILRARFNYLDDFWTVLKSVGWSLTLVLIGIFFIQTTKDRIAKDIFDPLISNLLHEKPLDIIELEDLRRKIRTSRELESEKAVMLAIRENNQQVAHDMRSPIAAMSALIEMMDLPSSQLKLALDRALNRAKSVANFLLHSELKNSELPKNLNFDIVSVVKDIITEKGPLFTQGVINYSGPIVLKVGSELTIASLARILSNVIDNSIHACVSKKEITIKLDASKNAVRIAISDSGIGISQDDLEKVGTKGFSQKSNGTGRGVFSAIKTLKDIGGTFSLGSELGRGTTVNIEFPIATIAMHESIKSLDSETIDFILIDDEELHRTTWEIWASKNGLVLKTFPSVEEFLVDNASLNKQTPLFLDSNLGTETRGEVWAGRLGDQGYHEIYLATSNSRDSIANNQHLKGIIGKNPTVLRQILKSRYENIAIG